MSTLNSNYPAQLDTVQSLLQVVNNYATVLSSNINDAQTTIQVASVTGLLSPGVVSVESEAIYYTSTQILGGVHSLLGCIRGFDGTSAAAHAGSSRLESRWVAVHHNLVAEAIAAIQAELGVAPSSNFATVAERLDLNTPVVVPISPAALDWSFTHDRKRIVMVQLYRKMATNQYELFEANVEQVVNVSGLSNVNITLGANEEGYIVVL